MASKELRKIKNNNASLLQVQQLFYLMFLSFKDLCTEKLSCVHTFKRKYFALVSDINYMQHLLFPNLDLKEKLNMIFATTYTRRQ